MTAEKTQKKAPPRKRRWLKRIGLGILAAGVLAAVFHRPIFFEGTRYFILRAAKQQNLDLDYEMSGSIFTTLTVANLRAKPTEPGPIQRLEIGHLNLQYSLWDLIRDGSPSFLKLLDIQNLYLEIVPEESLTPAKEAQPQRFKFPALFPDTLNIGNVNVVVRASSGTTEVTGAFFSLLPDRPGVLKIQTLDIPGVRRWSNISGATTFRNRNLMLTELSVGPEISLTRFILDASKLEDDELRVGLDGAFFSAPTKISAHITDLNKSNHLDVQADVSRLAFEPLWKYFNLEAPLPGSLDRLSVNFHGELEKPLSWSGSMSAELSGLSFEQHVLGSLAFSLTLAERRAQLTLKDNFDDQNILSLSAEGELPKSLDGFPRMEAKGELTISAPDLSLLTRSLPERMEGDARTVTQFQFVDGRLTTQTSANSSRLATLQLELKEARLTLDAERDLTTKPDAPFFESLHTRLEGTIAQFRFQDYVAESIQLALSSREEAAAVEHLSLSKGANSLSLKANYALPADLQSWASQPLKIDLAVLAPELQAFVAQGSGATLQGSLNITGKAETENRILNGDFVIEGRNIKAQGLPIHTLDGRLEIVKNEARLSPLAIVFDDRNKLQAEGSMQIVEPYAYRGNLDAQLADLSRFQSLLVTGSSAPALGGALRVLWSGTGDMRAPQHAGHANIDLSKGRLGDQKNVAAHLTAFYSPEFINIPDFYCSAGDLGNAGFSLFWKDDRLRMSNLNVRQKNVLLLEGSLDAPLHLSEYRNWERLIPNNEPLKLALITRNLDLRRLFLQLGQKTPPVIGTVNLDLSAEGTLDELTGKMNLRASGIQSTAADEFDPADISLDLEVRDDRLRINGIVRQKLIQPLTITGNLPFDTAVIKKQRAIDPQTPIDLRVNLPSSSLAFLSTLVPAIRQSRGTAAVDVRMGGTIASPNLTGTATSDLSALRFTDPSLPPINAATLRLNFTHDRVMIERCAGGIAGGSFSAGGRVTFARLDNPVFDLQLGTHNALVVQNDDLSVRVSSNLRVTGALNAGTVAGTIFVTRSRFFKNIDILPIGLPGRPAPQPPEEPTVISFRQPPLRDWKFDVTIRTSDPFLIQSNLARGTIVMDARVGGTGLEPWMEGSVRIEQLVASLPFSRLRVDSGLIYFTKTRPFLPQLDLRGTSTIRDYRITVYITGPVTEPEAVFTSDPPLLQTDIVSLIATGMTTSELGRDPNAIAGRAVVLLFQKLYRSAFQRNQPPSDNESLLSRIQFDLGATDPKTGKQSAAFGIPLSDQIMLTGGLDVGGNFRGQVKYLIRFK